MHFALVNKDKHEKYSVTKFAETCDYYKEYYGKSVDDQRQTCTLHFTCNLYQRTLKERWKILLFLDIRIFKCRNFGILFNLNFFTFLKQCYLKYILNVSKTAH